jgi:hypothetical protein
MKPNGRRGERLFDGTLETYHTVAVSLTTVDQLAHVFDPFLLLRWQNVARSVVDTSRGGET